VRCGAASAGRGAWWARGAPCPHRPLVARVRPGRQRARADPSAPGYAASRPAPACASTGTPGASPPAPTPSSLSTPTQAPAGATTGASLDRSHRLQRLARAVPPRRHSFLHPHHLPGRRLRPHRRLSRAMLARRPRVPAAQSRHLRPCPAVRRGVPHRPISRLHRFHRRVPEPAGPAAVPRAAVLAAASDPDLARHRRSENRPTVSRARRGTTRPWTAPRRAPQTASRPQAHGPRAPPRSRAMHVYLMRAAPRRSRPSRARVAAGSHARPRAPRARAHRHRPTGR
jgi:hypothetical protein